MSEEMRVALPRSCTEERCSEEPTLRMSRKNPKLRIECPDHGIIEQVGILSYDDTLVVAQQGE